MKLRRKNVRLFNNSLLALILFGFLLGGCGLLDSKSPESEIGIIERVNSDTDNQAQKKEIQSDDFQFHKPDEMVEVPDTVQTGKSFVMKVWTIGTDSCWQQDGADVDIKEASVLITPYDLPPAKGSECYAKLTYFFRNVEIQFGTPGEKMIQVKGKQIRYNAYEEKMVVREKKIVVE